MGEVVRRVSHFRKKATGEVLEAFVVGWVNDDSTRPLVEQLWTAIPTPRRELNLDEYEEIPAVIGFKPVAKRFEGFIEGDIITLQKHNKRADQYRGRVTYISPSRNLVRIRVWHHAHIADGAEITLSANTYNVIHVDPVFKAKPSVDTNKSVDTNAAASGNRVIAAEDFQRGDMLAIRDDGTLDKLRFTPLPQGLNYTAPVKKKSLPVSCSKCGHNEFSGQMTVRIVPSLDANGRTRQTVQRQELQNIVCIKCGEKQP